MTNRKFHASIAAPRQKLARGSVRIWRGGEDAMIAESRGKEARFFQKFKEALSKSKAVSRNCLA